MIEEKIKANEEEIAEQEKRIAESNDTIVKKKQMIEELKNLKKRMEKIHNIRYFENIGSVDRIAELANRYRLSDFFSAVAKAADVRFDYSIKAMPLMDLTVWQSLFLFFGDPPSKKKESPAEAVQEKEE